MAAGGLHQDPDLQVPLGGEPDVGAVLEGVVEVARDALEAALGQLEVPDLVEGVALENPRGDLVADQVPEPVEPGHPVGLQEDGVAPLLRLVPEGDLLLLVDRPDDPVQENAVQGDGVVDLHEDRHRGDAVEEPVQDPVGRLPKGLAELPHHVPEGHHQGQFRVVEDLQVLHQVLAHPVDPLLHLVQGEAGVLQQQQVPLDRPDGRPELVAQPGAGDRLPLHEDPQDLAQAEQLRLRALVTNHRVFLPL